MNNIDERLEDLRIDLEQSRLEGYQKYDKSTYCLFTNRAFQIQKELEEKAKEAKRLYLIALRKYNELNEIDWAHQMENLENAK